MRIALALAAVVAFSSAAKAAVDLSITEIWAGGLSGAENTSDWFEVTNLGDMAATSLDGSIYYDDDSFDPTKDDALVGVDTIAPGESVIYVVSWEDDYATSADAIAAFTAMWGSLSGVQIGYVDGGSGLGGGGDAVSIFDGNTGSATELARGTYSLDAQEESFVPVSLGSEDLDAFSSVGDVSGAYASLLDATSSNGAPAIGSPGSYAAPVIPEPTSLVVFAGLAGVAALRRR